jgi:hypothetical protein
VDLHRQGTMSRVRIRCRRDRPHRRRCSRHERRTGIGVQRDQFNQCVYRKVFDRCNAGGDKYSRRVFDQFTRRSWDFDKLKFHAEIRWTTSGGVVRVA